MNRNGTSGTVVCGVDGGETMPAVLSAGRRLAAVHDAQLVVVHAFDEPVIEAQAVMTAIHRQTADDRHVEARLVEGSAADVLLAIASDEQADWLVTGLRSGARQKPDVSVSHRLARDAPCPLVGVPRRASDLLAAGRERTVVCGVDGSAHALAAAHVASELATRLRHRVVVVHAPREARSAMASPAGIVRTALGAVGGEPTSSVVERGPPAEVLRAVARREDGAAIVVAQRGAGGVPAALLGSVASSLISSSDVPVVVLSERAERRAA